MTWRAISGRPWQREHPAAAPLMGSSSEEEDGGGGGGGSGGGGTNWIGVCSARLQTRVWAYSVTFILVFILAMGRAPRRSPVACTSNNLSRHRCASSLNPRHTIISPLTGALRVT